MAKIKTIDINCLEWFDKVNGNSYFAGTVTTNYGTKSAKEHILPFQYGYGSHYQDMAFKKLKENKAIKTDLTSLWRHCDENNIILRSSMQENCLQRELKAIG